VPPNQNILKCIRYRVSGMQTAGQIWGRQWNDELARRKDLSICGELRLEEAALLPPRIPARFDRLRRVGFEMRMVKGVQNLLLADGCIVDEFVDGSGRQLLLVALGLGRRFFLL
jgi:hypothetical protein